MILADTDVLIDAMHAKEPAYSRISMELGTGRLSTTAITAFELRAGGKTEKQRQKIETLLSALTIIPLDDAAATKAGQTKRTLEAAGIGIGTADYLIAGIALSRSAILLTRNRAHFERVPELILGNLT